MKKEHLFRLLLIAAILLPAMGIAQEVTISGELRPRFEMRHGYKTLAPDDIDPAAFVSQRTRLNAFYKNENFRLGLVIQDVRVWGDVPQLNNSDVYGPAIHEAWGEAFISQKLSVKVGRQEIIYDDQRIFGSVGWAQQARSHDAAIIKYMPSEKHRIDVGLAYNNNGESLFKQDYTVNSYKRFAYLWYHGNFNKIGLSFLALNNGMAYQADSLTQKVACSQTVGPRLTYKDGAISANAAFYAQMGKNKSNRELSAMYFGAGINFNVNDKFSLGIGGEYLSGTSSKDQADASADDKSFTPLYGTNHKFNGWMDYFYVGNYSGSNGLIDINLPLSLKINKISFKLVPHYFMVAADLAIMEEEDNWKSMDSGLGTEIDFSMTYAASKTMVFSAGYSQMFATESMQAIKGGNHENSNNWAWVMITFKPTFFKSANQ